MCTSHAAPIPIDTSFESADQYVDELLAFATTHELFQQLCGGVHILDFCTADVYTQLLPPEWRDWFARNDLADIVAFILASRPVDSVPSSLEQYVLAIRRFRLRRDFQPRIAPARLPRHVAVGMKPKKGHEVSHFAAFVDSLAEAHQTQQVVDFGSGQNYLGRVLASPLYDRRVVALENQEHNIAEARAMDITAKLVPKQAFPQKQASNVQDSDTGNVRYVTMNIEDGELKGALGSTPSIVVSLHSCGNLVHHGLRALLVNDAVKAVAMVGCCYNLVTERLGSPSYKLPGLRTPNARLEQTSSRRDPHGFPMSAHMAKYRGEGVKLNITARMMACQAPRNWSKAEYEGFFTRHFYRSLLQRILMDRGHLSDRPALIIGSLRKTCYGSFRDYVRGAARKMADLGEQNRTVSADLDSLSDADIDQYESRFLSKKKEVSVVWTLMAFSAELVEALIVLDRWLFLREQPTVSDCWVETVFDYAQSPRNLVVVGIKRAVHAPAV